VVQALSTLGKTSLMVSQTVVTLNGQPAPIQSAVQTNYLEASSTTQSTTSGIAPTSTLTPGAVTTGFTALVVPKVVNNRILLGLSLTLSDLLSMDSVSSNGSSIQTPKVSVTAEEQSVSLKPGQTLMLTGFRQVGGSANDAGVGNPDFKALGGGKDATSSHQMLVVLVTARLL
jgi:type IVB pilus formation R64 PilN family outer membrane protein